MRAMMRAMRAMMRPMRAMLRARVRVRPRAGMMRVGMMKVGMMRGDDEGHV